MDEYDVTRAARAIERFVLDELSNWYVRRSRRRFWKGEIGADKLAAYHTLYTVLDGVARLLAPFVPFLSEEIHLALRGRTAETGGGASVHLASFPEADLGAVDSELEATMETALQVASIGRTVRNDAGIRVRQPLARILVHATDAAALLRFLSNREVVALVLDELNVREIVPAEELEAFVHLTATPAFPVLGKKYAQRVPKIAEAIKRLDTPSLLSFARSGTMTLAVEGEPVELTREDASVAVTPVDGYGAREEKGITVIADLELTDELKLEGAARELINRLQNLRKSSGYDVTDRIRLRYSGGSEVDRVFQAQGALIAAETLSEEMAGGQAPWIDTTEFELNGERVTVWIQKSR